MKKLKKLLGVLIAVTVSASLIGCRDKNSTSEANNESKTEIPENSAVQLANIEKSEYFSDFDLDTSFDSPVAEIKLSNDNTEINGNGAEYKNNRISITNGGTYILSGNLTDGQIYVNSEENVHLVFDGVNIKNTSLSPVFIENAKNASITLADNSENILEDGSENIEADLSDAVIYSKDDLSLNGSGSLTVNANFNEGITTKNDLRITGGNISVTSVGNGIKGKDSVAVRDAVITINSEEDGIKTSNTKETDKGYIYLESGTFNINAHNDAFQSDNTITVIDGEYNIKTGDGANSVQNASPQMPFGNNGTFEAPQIPDNENGEMQIPQMPEGGFKRSEMPDGNFETPQMPTNENGEMQMPEGSFDKRNMDAEKNNSESSSEEESTESQKGFKSEKGIVISGGKITADCVDDSIHSGGDILINDGNITLKTGDDGIHSDVNVTVSNGKLNIEKSYEGIEGIIINIDGGEININAGDDGMNASDGTTNPDDAMASSPNCQININGGRLNINADGDGIDSNGSITINNGETIVNGSEMGADSALDCGTDITINGGILAAAGSSEMLETPSDSSKQNIIAASFEQQNADTEFSITDKNGNTVYSCNPSKKYSAVIISCPEIKTGSEYNINVDDKLLETVTISDTVTTIGNITNGFGGGRGNKGDFGGGHGFPFGEHINPFENEQSKEI